MVQYIQRALLFYCVILLAYTGHAQNLVPNSSFEQMNLCPTESGQIRFPPDMRAYPLQSVSNWISATTASPDYFNGCATENSVAVPNNYLGYHPANTGQGYVGLTPFSTTISDPPAYWAEYVEVQLLAPLQADSFYEVSCYVRAAPKPNPPNIARMAVSAFAAVFTDTMLLGYSTPLDAEPVKLVAQGNTFLEDTTAWVKVTGHYKAKGGERWLTLGGHFTGFIPALAQLGPKPPVAVTNYHTYYLLDDVSVSNHPPCDTFIARHDTAICKLTADLAIITSTAPPGSYYNWNTGETTASISVGRDSMYVCHAIYGCDLYIDSFRVRMGFDTLMAKPYRSLSFCEGEQRTISAEQEGEAYVWSTGEYTRSIVVNRQAKYICYIKVGCTIFIEEYNVYLLPGVNHIKNPAADTTICEDVPFTIGRSFDTGLQYKWNTGDTVCCISPVESGLYTVTISSEHCGSITDSALVDIKDCKNCVWLPDAFTPNRDGLNDIFRAVLSCPVGNFSFRVFNRWGQEVFHTQNPATGWNGMHGAHLADVGTYYYYIEYNTVYNTTLQSLKGDVSLLR